MLGGVAFIGGFYVMLVGVRMTLAYVIGRNRHAFSPQLYQRILLGSAALLVVLGGILMRDGFISIWTNL
jgi:hypothetical protein